MAAGAERICDPVSSSQGVPLEIAIEIGIGIGIRRGNDPDGDFDFDPDFDNGRVKRPGGVGGRSVIDMTIRMVARSRRMCNLRA